MNGQKNPSDNLQPCYCIQRAFRDKNGGRADISAMRTLTTISVVSRPSTLADNRYRFQGIFEIIDRVAPPPPGFSPITCRKISFTLWSDVERNIIIIIVMANDTFESRLCCVLSVDRRKNNNNNKSLQRPPALSLLQSLNGRLLFAIIASAFGSAFQHGYNTGVVNAPQTVSMIIRFFFLSSAITALWTETFAHKSRPCRGSVLNAFPRICLYQVCGWQFLIFTRQVERNVSWFRK